MGRLTRPFCLLIAVQCVCLGIGFWFQYQLAVSTTESEAKELAWSELSTRSVPTISVVRNLTQPNLDWASFSKIVPQKSLDEDPFQPAMLLTDSQGFILGFTKAALPGGWHAGDRMIWKSDRQPSATDSPRLGRVMTASGERTGITYPTKNADRQVVIYVTAPTAPSWKKSVQSSLALSSALGFFWTLSLSVVATFLLTSRFNLNAANKKAELDHDALRNAQDLLRTRDAVIFGLAKLAESRDPETGHHLERISLYTTRLAAALRPYPKYQRIVTPTYVRLLGISSVLHDIGKVGVEDEVLLKPGKLTDEERKRMQQHTLVAGDCLKEIEQRLGASNFLQTAREIALHHHERWDGGGYPYGLSGEEIPLVARIVAIADVYDALSSKRVYKNSFPHHECVAAIREGAGTQFDPELVEVFLEIESEFAGISKKFANSSEETTSASSTNEIHSAGRSLSNSGSDLVESSVNHPLPCETAQTIESVA